MTAEQRPTKPEARRPWYRTNRARVAAVVGVTASAVLAGSLAGDSTEDSLDTLREGRAVATDGAYVLLAGSEISDAPYDGAHSTELALGQAAVAVLPLEIQADDGDTWIGFEQYGSSRGTVRWVNVTEHQERNRQLAAAGDPGKYMYVKPTPGADGTVELQVQANGSAITSDGRTAMIGQVMPVANVQPYLDDHTHVGPIIAGE